MEEGIITTLRTHAKQADEYPEIRASIEEHLAVSQRHAVEVKRCLEVLGADTSMLKTGAAKAGAFFGGMPAAMADDTVLKNLLAELATEHFEIACYTSIITAAQELGHAAIADVCETIREDEESMAELLMEALPQMTRLHLRALEPSPSAA